MPLPSDPQAVKTGGELVAQLQGIFGKHPGFRPAHAKGLLLPGTFTPATTAASLSSAPHLKNPSTPITVRFSSSTGIPVIPDTDPNGDPRGLAIRFHLPEKDGRRQHTDIVAHSVPAFPTRTGAEFLEFLQAIAASGASTEKPSPVEKFLGGHPTALAFVKIPKPTPVSFANEPYFGVSAFKFVGGEKETYFRYLIKPDAGVKTLDAEGLKGKDANFLYEELAKRIKDGPVTFTLQARIAEEGDTVDDATVQWPESRKVVDLGKLTLDSVVEETKQGPEQKKIIYDPIPRVEGIEASADPLLEVRAAAYLLSGKERRAA